MIRYNFQWINLKYYYQLVDRYNIEYHYILNYNQKYLISKYYSLDCFDIFDIKHYIIYERYNTLQIHIYI